MAKVCVTESLLGEWSNYISMYSIWSLATDALPPQEAKDLEESLGIEQDTPEHAEVERCELCAPRSLKRKRL